MSQVPLNQWLAQANAGDVTAVGALLDYQRAELRRFAEEQLPPLARPRIDASDLVQQTCLSVFRSLAEFEGSDPAQFMAWVRKIHERNIKNAIRDHFLAQRRAVQREASVMEAGQMADTAPSPSELVRGADEREQLLKVLLQLPPEEQEILRLRYWDGCTLSTICQRQNLTRDAAAWLMQKALKRAKSLLE